MEVKIQIEVQIKIFLPLDEKIDSIKYYMQPTVESMDICKQLIPSLKFAYRNGNIEECIWYAECNRQDSIGIEQVLSNNLKFVKSHPDDLSRWDN